MVVADVTTQTTVALPGKSRRHPHSSWQQNSSHCAYDQFSSDPCNGFPFTQGLKSSPDEKPLEHGVLMGLFDWLERGVENRIQGQLSTRLPTSLGPSSFPLRSWLVSRFRRPS